MHEHYHITVLIIIYRLEKLTTVLSIATLVAACYSMLNSCKTVIQSADNFFVNDKTNSHTICTTLHDHGYSMQSTILLELYIHIL